MKLLYCIFVICIAVNAEPLPPTREQLEHLVQLIWQNVEGASESIKKDMDDIDKAIKQKLLENLLVKEVKSDLNEKLAKSIDESEENREKLLDCSISVEEEFKKLAAQIYWDLLENVTNGRYVQRGNHISAFKKSVFEVEDALQNQADKEIELCLDGNSRCRLTDEFLAISEEYLAFRSFVERAFDTLDGYLKSKKIISKIAVDFTNPAYDCLNKV